MHDGSSIDANLCAGRCVASFGVATLHFQKCEESGGSTSPPRCHDDPLFRSVRKSQGEREPEGGHGRLTPVPLPSERSTSHVEIVRVPPSPVR